MSRFSTLQKDLRYLKLGLQFLKLWIFLCALCSLSKTRCGYPTLCWQHLVLHRRALCPFLDYLQLHIRSHLKSNHVSGVTGRIQEISLFIPRSFGATNHLPGVITAVFTKEIPQDVVRALLLCTCLLFHLAGLQTLLSLRNSSGRAVLQPGMRTITA